MKQCSVKGVYFYDLEGKSMDSEAYLDQLKIGLLKENIANFWNIDFENASSEKIGNLYVRCFTLLQRAWPATSSILANSSAEIELETPIIREAEQIMASALKEGAVGSGGSITGTSAKDTAGLS